MSGPSSVEVSVVIPCYNGEGTIARQLQALSAQVGAPPFEVIVVLNGCTDDSRFVVEEFARSHQEMTIRVEETRKGRSRARNHGAVVAHGDIVAFCDADDTVFPDWLTHLAARTEQLHGIVGGSVVHKYVNTLEVLRVYGKDPEEEDPATRADLPPDDFTELREVAEGNFAVWREDYLAVGGMDASFVGGLEGTDLCMRAQLQGIPVNSCQKARIHYWLRDSPQGTFAQQRGLARAKLLFFVRHFHTGRSAGASFKYSAMGLARSVVQLPSTMLYGTQGKRQRGLHELGGHLGSTEGHLLYRVLRRIPEPELIAERATVEIWSEYGRKAFYRARIRRWFSLATRRINRQVARGHRIPPMPRRRRVVGSVWAIAMVKNEVDVIRAFVHHVFEQGIDCLLIVDNGSTDGTRETLQALARRYPIILGRDTELAYYQAHKMSRLAHLARRAGADWVIPMDADEFWMAEKVTVAEFLRACPAEQVAAHLHNAFPTHGAPKLEGPAGEMRLDLDPGPHSKRASRTHPGMWITMGNHQIERPGVVTTGLYVLHLPWRDIEQFKRKAKQGAVALQATDLPEELGVHWRAQALLSESALDERWSRLLKGHGDPEMDWTPGPRTVVVKLENLSNWSAVELPRSME